MDVKPDFIFNFSFSIFNSHEEGSYFLSPQWIGEKYDCKLFAVERFRVGVFDFSDVSGTSGRGGARERVLFLFDGGI